MKRTIFLLLLIFTCLNIYSQPKEMIEKFLYYKGSGKFKIIDNKVVMMTHLFENIELSEEQFTPRLMRFLSNLYESENKFYIDKNYKDSGIYGQGVCNNLKEWYNVFNGVKRLNASYFFNIDINTKEKKVVIIFGIPSWLFINVYVKNGVEVRKDKEGYIVDYFPFKNQKFVDKDKELEAFLNLIDRLDGIIDEFGNYIYIEDYKIDTK